MLITEQVPKLMDGSAEGTCSEINKAGKSKSVFGSIFDTWKQV